MSYHTYILECSDKTFYVGCTNNLKRRLFQHNNSKWGAHYKTLCTQNIVVLKDGTQKLMQHEKVNFLDLNTVSTIDGEPLDYTSGSARLPLSFFFIADKNYDIQIVTKSLIPELLFFLFSWLLAVTVFLEVFRRVFYYVVFGRIRPN